jgi:hypothetical protein
MGAAYTRNPKLAKNVEFVVALDASLTKQPPAAQVSDVFEV